MRSNFNLTGAEQKAEQAERLLAMAKAKHELAARVATVIGLAAARQTIYQAGESPEDYLARVGYTKAVENQ